MMLPLSPVLKLSLSLSLSLSHTKTHIFCFILSLDPFNTCNPHTHRHNLTRWYSISLSQSHSLANTHSGSLAYTSLYSSSNLLSHFVLCAPIHILCNYTLIGKYTTSSPLSPFCLSLSFGSFLSRFSFRMSINIPWPSPSSLEILIFKIIYFILLVNVSSRLKSTPKRSKSHRLLHLFSTKCAHLWM